MTIDRSLLSSKSIEHETPQLFFDRLHKTWDFTLDPCCTDANAKCDTYMTSEHNGLEQSWQGHRVFMNPPYGRQIGAWIEKACEEWEKGECLIVGLLPARLDTKWFQDYIYERHFWEPLRGRITFEKNGKPVKTRNRKTGIWKVSPAPFPTILVYWLRLTP